ncbi:MAG: phytanoyl-CoA dioxygenase family protein [Sphingomonas sp.]|jgi:hypothetical protein
MTLAQKLLPGVPIIESPLFALSIDSMGLSAAERDIAVQLNERGYAVLDFPDDEIHARIDRIKASLGPRFGVDFADPASLKNAGATRVQDAWKFDADVKAIACNQHILALLGKLYGRRAFPFQTLNFPVGTQQHMHSDSIHFSSVPERFMCGVWLAMEDIGPDAGPLIYYPGSHKMPILTNEMLGRLSDVSGGVQEPYEEAWRNLVVAHGFQPEIFCAKKGQVLIWAANLLHGGSPQHDLRLTRWSQVTHYYFEDSIYYTPAASDASIGRLQLRNIEDIESGKIMPNTYLGKPVSPASGGAAKGLRKTLRKWLKPKTPARDSRLPADFDAKLYYELNPDVVADGRNAADHYLVSGISEGRRYR